ncbi:L-threonylcarbamoyladenylate synthase [Pedobacter sp. CG_S7]|uniref:L-threonylcarbamoyladenylate synthase n=1 Tax=Pedobacter sp. CG_S7 TaxID=3143930 RepID=UPI003394178A
MIKNKLIAIPTETVYGLAGNAFSETAIKKIFALKKRPEYNPFIVHIKSFTYLNEIAKDIPPDALKLAEYFWPGPLTLVLKKRDCIPDSVTAGSDTVAVRVPNHLLTLELLAQLDFPLVAPSANPFGSISPTSAQHVQNYFNTEIEVIMDGGCCERGIESTIIGFEDNQPILYRHGALSIEEIEKVIGPVALQTNSESKPNAPGMLSRHYAPITALFVTTNINQTVKLFRGQKIGLLVFKDSLINDGILDKEILSASGDFLEAASNLFGAMHRLDKLNLDVIIAEKFPDKDLGKTINDRLERASKRK